MTTAQIESLAWPEHTHDLASFCQSLFSSFSRSDQRKWGEVYVRGLVSLPGRKTIRRISDHVVGRRADQSLQQFVNQSPWRWEPVRSALAAEVSAALRPDALVFEEAVFPKNGASSVGVAKQFAPSSRRVLNCQLGMAAFLTGPDGAVPVDWRLQLPREWDGDAVRRERTRVPVRERHRPRWVYALEMLDEMHTWDVPIPPVVVDARYERQVEGLLRGLEDRELQYVVRVAEDTPIAVALPANARGPAQPRTAGELVREAGRLGRMTLNWRETTNGVTSTSRFVLAPVLAPGQVRPTPGRPYRRTRYALAERVAGRPRPDSIHLTNITHARLPDLVHLVRLRRRTTEDLYRLQEDGGLNAFEGRSYGGWHHHVTLTSVAHAYRVLRDAEKQAPFVPSMRQHSD